MDPRDMQQVAQLPEHMQPIFTRMKECHVNDIILYESEPFKIIFGKAKKYALPSVVFYYPSDNSMYKWGIKNEYSGVVLSGQPLEHIIDYLKKAKTISISSW